MAVTLIPTGGADVACVAFIEPMNAYAQASTSIWSEGRPRERAGDAHVRARDSRNTMRRRITTPRTLLAALLLIAASACDRGKATPPGDQHAAADDYGHMAQVYQRMADRYGAMGPAMHQDAQWMEQMHAQMAHLGQQEIMGGRGGMMGGRGGMMGGRGGMMGRRGGMTGGASMSGNWMSGMDRWHDQMAQLNDQWATQAENAGNDDVAKLHREAAGLHRKTARELQELRPQAEQPGPEPGGEQRAGASLYDASCAACHGTEGQGAPGAFPALAGNALLDGPADRMIDIVRHGLSGPIEAGGLQYNGAMPSFDGRFSPAQLAAILTYVRGTWGNHGSAVTAAQVAGS
ncbi:MAG: cytochrome c [Kofleriaceae bacterium]